ncbi:AAA family ATPase [Candidatus Poriferisodalis sp.]|uniref:AAA family ATPase n=1 Tax=Candidatus Poriferisodalis sp. TaxID=3101277 RepID=UPI003B5AAA6B
MKPHRLAFCALGPYADEVEIDFDPLVEEGLFLIHGPTGAGKTFLLDALCFALYGDVPGERAKHTLRSDHAPLDVNPWAELEFTSQGHRWRVRRSPEHESAKVRGEGTTRRAAEATLERREGDEWRAVAAKIREVNDEIAGLLGLTAQQFQQVILLPQGRFERVLRSNSEDREKLLRTLFDTAVFGAASEWLDNAAKSRQAAAAEHERELANLRRRAAERWRSVTDDTEQPLSADRLDHETDTADAWPADQAALDELVHNANSLMNNADTAAETADGALKAARSTHDTINRIAEHWDRRAGLLKRREELADERPAIDASRETLHLADSAEHLRRLLGAEQHHQDELARCTTSVNAQIAAFVGRCNEAPSLPEGLAVPAADETPTAQDLDVIGTELAVHRSKLNDLAEDAAMAEKRESAGTSERDAEAHHRQVEQEQTAAAANHERERQVAEKELIGARSAADQVAALQAAANLASQRADAASELDLRGPRLTAAEGVATVAVRATLDRRREALDLRQRYLEGIAAVLAGTLQDAEPCPVCGSTDHPYPAEPAGDAVVVEDVETAEAAAAGAEQAETRARKMYEQLAEESAELRGRAGDTADDPEGGAALAEEASALLQTATQLAGQVEGLGKTVTAHRDNAIAAEQAAKQAALDANTASERANAAEDEASTLRTGIADQIGDIDPVTAVEAITPIEEAVQALTTAEHGRTAAKTTLRATADALDALIAPSPFATPEEARAAVRSVEERGVIRQRVDTYDTESRDVHRDLETDALQGLPEERPDTDAPADALADAEAAARAANDRRTITADTHTAISGWLADHRGRSKTYATALAEAQLWSTVADRCNGRTPPKVSLQRWVLSAYLEEICTFANRRLGSMTSGRYRLSVHRDREWGGGKAGLGLRVHDVYTGHEREVSTLSGGETFQASLSLALGVADVVTSHAGGVRLDALFVDEGFGTLDSEALQLAMDELDRLREGGRTVGLISHVGGLRERIRTGIEVCPTDRGSTVSVGSVSPV